ncbi:MAG: hypothetical protein MUF73_04200 [Rhodobacteraceae bacterium]|jgi:hypothetical protein|nr:hypothetical protein [Paracoccaceae bacterium]
MPLSRGVAGVGGLLDQAAVASAAGPVATDLRPVTRGAARPKPQGRHRAELVTAVPTVHAVIFSWKGHGAKARQIASALDGHADRTTVVYSNPANEPEDGSGDWVQVDDAMFFGQKFAAGAGRHGAEDYLLVIQADAVARDWPDVIRALRRCAAQRAELGVWTPAIDGSFFHSRCLTVCKTSDPRYEHVSQTDGVVLAIHLDILARLRELDFRVNNLGWGIDKFANSVALSLGLEIILDRSVSITHAVGGGYNRAEAAAQMDAFLSQMTERERVLYQMLEDSFYAANRRQRRSRLARYLRPFQRVRD